MNLPDYIDDDRVRDDEIGDTENAGYLKMMIQQAPRDVRLVLTLFLDSPGDLVAMAEQAWAMQHRGHRDMNAMVKRLLGPSVGDDPIGAVCAYFVGT